MKSTGEESKGQVDPSIEEVAAKICDITGGERTPELMASLISELARQRVEKLAMVIDELREADDPKLRRFTHQLIEQVHAAPNKHSKIGELKAAVDHLKALEKSSIDKIIAWCKTKGTTEKEWMNVLCTRLAAFDERSLIFAILADLKTTSETPELDDLIKTLGSKHGLDPTISTLLKQIIEHLKVLPLEDVAHLLMKANNRCAVLLDQWLEIK